MTTHTPPQRRRQGEVHHLDRHQCADPDCNRYFSVEYDRCPFCGSSEFEEASLNRTGTLMTYVVQYYLPSEFDSPVALGIMQTDDGGKIFGEVLGDPSNVEIGMALEAVVRTQRKDDNAKDYAVKFRPMEGDEDNRDETVVTEATGNE